MLKSRVHHFHPIHKTDVRLACMFILPEIAEHFAFVIKEWQSVFPLGCNVGITIQNYLPQGQVTAP